MLLQLASLEQMGQLHLYLQTLHTGERPWTAFKQQVQRYLHLALLSKKQMLNNLPHRWTSRDDTSFMVNAMISFPFSRILVFSLISPYMLQTHTHTLALLSLSLSRSVVVTHSLTHSLTHPLIQSLALTLTLHTRTHTANSHSYSPSHTLSSLRSLFRLSWLSPSLPPFSLFFPSFQFYLSSLPLSLTSLADTQPQTHSLSLSFSFSFSCLKIHGFNQLDGFSRDDHDGGERMRVFDKWSSEGTLNFEAKIYFPNAYSYGCAS